VPTSPDVLVPDSISANSLPADSLPVDSLPAAGLQSPNRPGLIKALVVVATIACILLVLWTMGGARSDPYSRQTLALQGSAERGGQLFLLNCAGCHGIAAQGIVGPDLHGVNKRKSQRQLIQQVVSGRTPPMPRFQPEPQAMADLLSFLNSLV
jgi:mono/diheme cytochrome c family protein